MPISAISNHIDRGCPPPKPKAGGSGSGNQKADWKKVFAGASGSSKGKA
jgi:E3 ubiquitin-protein ligase RAD18